MDSTKNPLKPVNIYPLTKIREIGSVASGQAISKAHRSAIKHNPKFSKYDESKEEEKSIKYTSKAQETSNQ